MHGRSAEGRAGARVTSRLQKDIARKAIPPHAPLRLQVLEGRPTARGAGALAWAPATGIMPVNAMFRAVRGGVQITIRRASRRASVPPGAIAVLLRCLLAAARADEKLWRALDVWQWQKRNERRSRHSSAAPRPTEAAEASRAHACQHYITVLKHQHCPRAHQGTAGIRSPLPSQFCTLRTPPPADGVPLDPSFPWTRCSRSKAGRACPSSRLCRALGQPLRWAPGPPVQHLARAH